MLFVSADDGHGSERSERETTKQHEPSRRRPRRRWSDERRWEEWSVYGTHGRSRREFEKVSWYKPRRVVEWSRELKRDPPFRVFPVSFHPSGWSAKTTGCSLRTNWSKSALRRSTDRTWAVLAFFTATSPSLLSRWESVKVKSSPYTFFINSTVIEASRPNWERSKVKGFFFVRTRCIFGAFEMHWL